MGRSVYGDKFYGKCDVVPGLFHVSTLFFMWNYVPIYPKSSHLMLDPSLTGGRTNCGIEIDFHWVSVVMTYMRGALCVAAATCALFYIQLVSHRPGDPIPASQREWLLFASAAVCMGLFGMSYMGLNVNYDRAIQLAKEARIDKAIVDAHFGLIEKPEIMPNLMQKDDFPFAESSSMPSRSPFATPSSGSPFAGTSSAQGPFASSGLSPGQSEDRSAGQSPHPSAGPFAMPASGGPFATPSASGGPFATPPAEGGPFAAPGGSYEGIPSSTAGASGPVNAAGTPEQSVKPDPYAEPTRQNAWSSLRKNPKGGRAGDQPSPNAGPKIEVEFDENGKPTFHVQ